MNIGSINLIYKIKINFMNKLRRKSRINVRPKRNKANHLKKMKQIHQNELVMKSLKAS